MCRQTNQNEQSMQCQNAVAVKTSVGIYVRIAECQHEIHGLINDTEENKKKLISL